MTSQSNIKYARYNRAADHTPQHSAESWEQLVKLFEYHAEATCTIQNCKGHDCEAKRLFASFSAVDIEGPCRAKVCKEPCHTTGQSHPGFRRSENVRAVTALLLDFDDLTQEQAETIGHLIDGYSYVSYTSHSHNPPNKHAFRVLMQLSRPVLLEGADRINTWKTWWQKAIQYLGIPPAGTPGGPDTACKDAARLYFLPNHPKGGTTHWTTVEPGKVLDVDEVAKTVLVAAEKKATIRTGVSDLPEAATGSPEAALINLLLPFWQKRNEGGVGRQQLTLLLTGMLLHAKWPMEAIIDLICGIMLQADDNNLTDRQRAWESTEGQFLNGGETAGGPSLQALLGNDEVYEQIKVEVYRQSDAKQARFTEYARSDALWQSAIDTLNAKKTAASTAVSTSIQTSTTEPDKNRATPEIKKNEVDRENPTDFVECKRLIRKKTKELLLAGDLRGRLFFQMLETDELEDVNTTAYNLGVFLARAPLEIADQFVQKFINMTSKTREERELRFAEMHQRFRNGQLWRLEKDREDQEKQDQVDAFMKDWNHERIVAEKPVT